MSARNLVAAPSYLERHGRPSHPRDLMHHACLCYAYLPTPDVWRFVNKAGEAVQVRPAGPLRANNADALAPALFAGLGLGGAARFRGRRGDKGRAPRSGDAGLVTAADRASPRHAARRSEAGAGRGSCRLPHRAVRPIDPSGPPSSPNPEAGIDFSPNRRRYSIAGEMIVWRRAGVLGVFGPLSGLRSYWPMQPGSALPIFAPSSFAMPRSLPG